MTKVAAIYARVSSDRQKENHTIASQLTALTDYAEAHEYKVPAEWRFQDEGYSGATQRRPGLEALRDLAAAGHLEAVLIYSPDRLSRKYAYQVLLAETLTGFCAQLRSRANTLDVSEQQKILRLLVKEILVGKDTLVIRHSIPIPNAGPDPITMPRPPHTPPPPMPQPGPHDLLRSGRHRRALGRSRFRRPELPFLQDPLRQKRFPQLPDSPVGDFRFYPRDQFRSRDGVEVALQIRIDHPTVALLEQRIDTAQRLLAAPLRTKPVALRREVPLKNRLQHCSERRLRHPVAYRGKPESREEPRTSTAQVRPTLSRPGLLTNQ